MPSPRYWREIPQRYRLEASKCKQCGVISFPPRAVCPECKSRDFDLHKLSETGKIVTYSVIHVPPREFSGHTPYTVAIIELADGVRLTAQVADASPDEVAIGKPVRLVFRRLFDEGKSGIRCYGYKCVLETENV
ncbi:transcriptional regulator [candidate division TA06 bacterium DG_26]|uniref:Transcriptional regulator n=1 Tax=candidate division TA06 bacterium DG_26 TaxID=1703771 RepID=A0A0S7WIA8_UNCT6|nr:MAG: transcriptional regulator [candidate division TA06 bacterium DG_26]